MSTNWNSEAGPVSIGFVGFGEAGSHIAKGLKSAGVTRIVAFDIDPERVRSNERETGVPLLGSNRELADEAQVIFSTVTCARARKQPNRPRHIFRPATLCGSELRFARVETANRTNHYGYGCGICRSRGNVARSAARTSSADAPRRQGRCGIRAIDDAVWNAFGSCL